LPPCAPPDGRDDPQIAGKIALQHLAPALAGAGRTPNDAIVTVTVE
jgi:hypothetical protein